MIDAQRLNWPLHTITPLLICILILNLSPYLAATQCSGPSQPHCTPPTHTNLCGSGNILSLGLLAMLEVSARPIGKHSVHQPSVSGWKPTLREKCCSVEGLLYLEQQTQYKWNRELCRKDSSPTKRKGQVRVSHTAQGWGPQTGWGLAQPLAWSAHSSNVMSLTINFPLCKKGQNQSRFKWPRIRP